MAIKIYSSPQRSEAKLEYSVDGDVLTINGQAFDLSVNTNISNPFVMQSFRQDGVAHVVFAIPYGSGEEPPPLQKPPEIRETGPVEFVPLTRFQFEMILELLNITQAQVFALIDGLDWTDMQKLVARKKVETGGNDGRWSRENPLWDILGPSLGVSKEQIDEKWKEAQAL